MKKTAILLLIACTMRHVQCRAIKCFILASDVYNFHLFSRLKIGYRFVTHHVITWWLFSVISFSLFYFSYFSLVPLTIYFHLQKRKSKSLFSVLLLLDQHEVPI
jgi:hypothetical protein